MLQDIQVILQSFKADLKVALGSKIGDIILFGSYSRGDFSEHSDVDLLILAKEALNPEESRIIDDLIAHYSLKYDTVISGLVYPADIFQKFNSPFLLNIKEEGVLI